MPITEEQRRKRKLSLGGSDMAAVMGVDPWRSAWDVWAEKTGKIVDLDEPNQAMIAGNMFENGVLDWAEKSLGTMERNLTVTCPLSLVPIVVNLDARLGANSRLLTEPVEAKTAGLFGPLNPDWGDEGTDQVPKHVVVQANTIMLCCQEPLCFVPAFLGGRGFAMFEVPANKDIQDMICEKATDFWVNCVQADTPPKDVHPSMDTMKRLIREPNKVVNIEDYLIDQWLVAKNNAKLLKEAADEFKIELIAALDDAESGVSPTMGSITYYEQHRKGYTVEPTSFRVPRHKKPKG